MTPDDLTYYLTVQNIALRVLRDIRPFIRVGVTEEAIAVRVQELLAEQGVTQTWYHQVPALVQLGENTAHSVSGKDYSPGARKLRMLDLVTIDVSPLLRGYWGDSARSYIIAEGVVVSEDEARLIPGTQALCEGLAAEKHLHHLLLRIAQPAMTLHDLHAMMNEEILRLGYENLDFRGNLGHSIEKHLDHRRYIESGNQGHLGDLRCFTFELHIRKPDGGWGFKRENIYYFEGERLIVLGSEELLKLL